MYRVAKLILTIVLSTATLPTTGHRWLRWAGVGAIAALVVLLNLTFASGIALAGTVTIVDGPDTDSGTATINDAYIESQLASGHFTVDTVGHGSGPDDLLVAADAMVAWTSEFSLTLRAGNDIVITGTLQHDGPPSGLGGVDLGADSDGDGSGSVIIGTGTQTSGVSAGSRYGLTRLDAVNLVLQGGSSGTTPFAMLGFRAVDQGSAYTVTGPISVTVSHNLTATGGSVVAYGFVQIGHGGADTVFDLDVDGDFVGPVAIQTGGSVTFQGNNNGAYAQLGNGGWRSGGNHGGDHHLDAGSDVIFQAGGDSGYAHLGNGGRDARGSHSGSLRLEAPNGSVTFQGGNDFYVYAHLGNGGWRASGNHSGDHHLDVGGDITFRGGNALDAYALFGNGGQHAQGNHRGDHHVDAGGDVTFQGGTALDAYAQLGNGAQNVQGSHSGGHDLDAQGSVTFQGGSGINAYTQFGNGGRNADGQLSGSLTLTTTANLTVTTGGGIDAYAMFGHGSNARDNPANNGAGTRSGDISVRVGATAVFSDAHVGHLSRSGILSVTQGSTLIGVSQNDPSAGTGQLIATGIVSFTSASASNGQLRIYLPGRYSQQLPTTTSLNSESFAVANTIPEDHIRGFYSFGDGSYSPDYSFYLGPVDAAIAKTIVITTVVNGAIPTEDWSFTGSGSIGGISLPAEGGSIILTPLLSDAGYTITETVRAEYTSVVNCDNGISNTIGISDTVNISDTIGIKGAPTLSNTLSITVAPDPGETIGCTFTNTQQSSSVEGRVQTLEGKGAAGVTVFLSDVAQGTLAMPWTTVTGPDGSYRFGYVPFGQYMLMVMAPGQPEPVHSQTVDVGAVLVTTVEPIVVSIQRGLYLPAVRK